jgi:hypothetical protein
MSSVQLNPSCLLGPLLQGRLDVVEQGAVVEQRSGGEFARLDGMRSASILGGGAGEETGLWLWAGLCRHPAWKTYPLGSLRIASATVGALRGERPQLWCFRNGVVRPGPDRISDFDGYRGCDGWRHPLPPVLVPGLADRHRDIEFLGRPVLDVRLT